MSMRYVSVLFAACALSAACSSALSPAPRAKEVAGPAEGAVTAAQGIRLKAQAGAWQGEPRNLHQQVTPMLVTIVNKSAKPVRIGYNQFRLVSESGRRYSALPPFQIDGKVSVASVSPYYPPTGFRYGPYLSPYFAGVPVYNRFATNPLYWDRFGPVMRTADLPTLDMLRKALPEGVLEPGGRVAGFLYFEGVGPEVDRVRLLADFPDTVTGERVTRLGIPFDVG